MKGLTLCAWRRPKYLQAVLDALSKCAGIEDYILYIGIDGDGGDETIEIARKVKFTLTDILLHTHRVGCNLNTKHIQMYAFQHFDYVVHLEDDTLPAPDTLRYFDWAKQFRKDSSIMTVSAWGMLPKLAETPDDNARVIKRCHFSSWGWATWKDRWQEMQQDWVSNDDMASSWDFGVEETRKRLNCQQIQPRISRINNIGSELGTHRGECRLTEWAGSPGFKAPDKFIAEWL